MLKKIIKAAAVLIFLAGAAVLIYPWAREMYGAWQDEQLVEEFEKMKSAGNEQTDQSGTGEGQRAGEEQPDEEGEERFPELAQGSFSRLRADMEAYNREIYESGQTGLQDAWNYEQEVFSLEEYDLDSDVIGYLESDAMDICLPLYIGASSEHLAQGAAVLGQTSMPIGGGNTNCVIAGHRGWRGTPMFRDIEALREGDVIWITNLWERLAYRVVRITVITPDDIDAVKIVEGQDMLTLFTCHPYTENYQRYVVYCTRTYDAVYGETEQEALEESDRELSGLLDERQGEHPDFVSSGESIERERKLSYAGAAGAAVLLVILAVLLALTSDRKKKRRKKRRHKSAPPGKSR